MVTIGGKYIILKEIGTVIWSWNDDEVKRYTHKLNNVLYFPDSSVNILSATELVESIKYDELTWVLTKKEHSIFTWYISKYKNTIVHSEHFLP